MTRTIENVKLEVGLVRDSDDKPIYIKMTQGNVRLIADFSCDDIDDICATLQAIINDFKNGKGPLYDTNH